MATRRPTTRNAGVKVKRNGETRDVNPILRYLLEGLAAQAQEDGKDRLVSTYRKALRSLRKYPLPIRSGKEAQILDGKISLSYFLQLN